MHLLFDRSTEVARFISERAPHAGADVPDGEYVGIGVGRGGKLVAGVLFYDWHPDAGHIEIAIAADTPSWAARGRLRSILLYAFNQLHVRRIGATIPAWNERCLNFAYGMGFKKEGVRRDYYPHDGDAVLLGMTRGDFAERWQ